MYDNKKILLGCKVCQADNRADCTEEQQKAQKEQKKDKKGKKGQKKGKKSEEIEQLKAWLHFYPPPYNLYYIFVLNLFRQNHI